MKLSYRHTYKIIVPHHAKSFQTYEHALEFRSVISFSDLRIL